MFSPPYNQNPTSWNDPETLKKVYIKEVEELVLKVTGGRKIYTDQVVIRNQFHTEVDGLANSQNSSTSNDSEIEERDNPDDEEFPKLIGVQQDTGASPAPKVHLDFAPLGARTHLRHYHPKTTILASEIVAAEEQCLSSHGFGANELEELGKGGIYDGPRWAMFSIWRPLKKVKRDPLAVGDCNTFPKGDYVEFGVLFPSIGKKAKNENKSEEEGEVNEREGGVGFETHREQAYLAYGPTGDELGERHDWYWIKDQDVDEVLVIQLFDSEAEKEGRGMGGGVMHSSVVVEGVNGYEDGEVKEARESCEVRCCVIW